MCLPVFLLLSVFSAVQMSFGSEREVVLLNSPGNSLVSFRFMFHVGSVQDPSGKEGVAALTAKMLSHGGSSKLTFQELIEFLYPMAAEISSQTDKETTTFIGRVHRDHLDRFFSVFRNQLLKPRFAIDDFDRNKTELLNYLTKSLRSADDEELGKKSLEWVLFEGHPYRHPVSGTVVGLQSITLDDVKSFYAKNYTFSNLQIGLAGDFPETFAQHLEADFKKELPEGNANPVKLPKLIRGTGMDVTIVERPAADSTAVSLGFPIDITRADADYYPLLVANLFLGDHRTFNGVLMKELRGKRGLNYGDYSYIEAFIQDGGSTFPLPNIARRQQYFSIWIRPVVTANAHFAIRGSIYYFRRLVEGLMSEKQFEGMRDYIRSYSKLWAQNLDRRLGYQMDSIFYQTGFFIDELEKHLDDMSVVDVNRVIRKYLDRWDFHVAIVTPEANTLATAIETNRRSPVTYQTSGTGANVLKEDTAIEVLELPISRIRVVPVDQIFEK